MRYYELEITDSKGKTISDSAGNVIGPWDTKKNPAGALNISFDVLITALDVASGGTVLSVYGLPLSVLSQSVNLFQANVTLYGGFSGGLPLENADQKGLILDGQVWNPYGNWEGVNQCLNLIINPAPLMNDDGRQLSIRLDGRKGEKLSDVLQRALRNAYPRTALSVSVSDSLILPEDWTAVYNRPSQLAVFLRSASFGLMKQEGYAGVSIVMQKGIIRIFDNLATSGATEINVADLIGQPTWIGLNKISLKTPLRGDLACGDILTLPAGVVNGSASLLSASTPEAFTWGRSQLNFSGRFQITSLRHVGEYRNAAGEAWVTIIEAIDLPSQEQKA